MTFCLGITVDEGLVGIADTRVVAGNECLVARKTATYQGPGFSFFIMHSGLRSARDKILLYFEEAFARQSMTAAALPRGQSVRAAGAPGPRGRRRSAAQRRTQVQRLLSHRRPDVDDSSHKLYLVYPEGNWVEIGPDTPYQIIGASGSASRFWSARSSPRTPCSTRSKWAFSLSMPPACAPRTSIFPWTSCSTPRQFRSRRKAVPEGRPARHLGVVAERMRNAVQDLPSQYIEAAFPSCVSP
jgi:putative proteasome-type protease